MSSLVQCERPRRRMSRLVARGSAALLVLSLSLFSNVRFAARAQADTTGFIDLITDNAWHDATITLTDTIRGDYCTFSDKTIRAEIKIRYRANSSNVDFLYYSYKNLEPRGRVAGRFDGMQYTWNYDATVLPAGQLSVVKDFYGYTHSQYNVPWSEAGFQITTDEPGYYFCTARMIVGVRPK